MSLTLLCDVPLFLKSNTEIIRASPAIKSWEAEKKNMNFRKWHPVSLRISEIEWMSMFLYQIRSHSVLIPLVHLQTIEPLLNCSLCWDESPYSDANEHRFIIIYKVKDLWLCPHRLQSEVKHLNFFCGTYSLDSKLYVPQKKKYHILMEGNITVIGLWENNGLCIP